MSECATAAELLADGLLTVAAASRLLSVSRSFLYAAMEHGDVPFVKLGRCRRIPRRALVEFAAAHLRGGASTAK